MNIFTILKINLRKLFFYKLKSLFLILPIIIIAMVLVVASSQIQNFKKGIDQSVLGSLEKQSTVFDLKKTVSNVFTNFEDFQNSLKGYSQTDVANIKKIANVKNAYIKANIPVSPISSSNLVKDKNLALSLKEMPEEAASIYTQDFKYEQDKAIPIILNLNNLTESYEDWKGQTEIKIEMNMTVSNAADAESESKKMEEKVPFKTRTVEVNKKELLGKEIEISIGGFTKLEDSTIKQDGNAIVFKKLTEKENTDATNKRKDSIAKYWDYEKLEKPITYKFKIVGFVEDEKVAEEKIMGIGSQPSNAYIPIEAAQMIAKKYFQNQIDAKKKDVPNAELNKNYGGLALENNSLSDSSFMSGPQMVDPNQTDPENQPVAMIIIPGLVYNTKTDAKTSKVEVTGMNLDSDIYAKSNKSGEVISVVVNEVYNMSQVIKDLKAAGYDYQTTKDYSIFSELRSKLDTTALGITIGFIVLAAIIVFLSVSKFVTDSTKEIGIFRAVGTTKIGILTLYLLQGIMYVAIAYLIGLGLGYLLNRFLSPIIYEYFNTYLQSTIKSAIGNVNVVDKSVFNGIDKTSIINSSIVIAIITIIMSFIPSMRGANMSVIKALKE